MNDLGKENINNIDALVRYSYIYYTKGVLYAKIPNYLYFISIKCIIIAVVISNDR